MPTRDTPCKIYDKTAENKTRTTLMNIASVTLDRSIYESRLRYKEEPTTTKEKVASVV